MPNGRSHTAHLAVAPLGELQLDPTIRDGLAYPDWNRARRQIGLRVQALGLGSPCALAFDDDTRTKRSERLVVWDPLNLGPIRARHMVARFGQRRPQPRIITKYEQTLAISIETASSPYAWQIDVVGQRRTRRIGAIGELRQNVVRLPESDGGHGGLRVPLDLIRQP